MTAAEAKTISLQSTKKPEQIEKLLEKIFVKIESAAKNGEYNIDFYEKKLADEHIIILIKYLANLGFKVNRNALGLNIYW